MTFGPYAETDDAFSPCRTWRYMLWRQWNHRLPTAMFVACNPSIASKDCDDPTVRKEVGFARHWGFGSVLGMNAYAFVSTDPARLTTATDPVGPDTDQWLLDVSARADIVVVAWGTLVPDSRAREVIALLAHRPLHCIGTTKSGRPRHPSRGGYTPEPVLFTP